MTEPSPRIQLSYNPDNSPNFLLNHKPLHSRHNPEQEVLRLAESLDLKPGELLVLIGIGAGYARVFGTITDPARIIYFEPIPEFSSFLNESGFVRDVETQGSRFFSDQGELLAHLSGRSGIRIVSAPRHRDFFPDSHQQLLSAIRTLDKSTTGAFFKRWAYCYFRALDSAEQAFLTNLETKADAPPSEPGPAVLFCGAAPTLSAELDQFDIERHFVIAADTALAPLLAMGIRPQLVISIDSGYGTLYHLRAAARLTNLESLTALAPLTAHPAVKDFFGRIIRYRSTFPLDQILGGGPLSKITEFINPTRNTVGLAILAARALNAVSFQTAGVSFVSSRGDSHARGTGYLLYALERNSRTNPVESYRIGGYKESLTNRNLHTKTALDAMLESWNKPGLASHSRQGRIRHDMSGESIADFVKILPGRELVQYLKSSWDQIQWAKISHLAATEDVARWKRRLSNIESE
ncbi:MAG: DUF115 domain-containing protein [Spirochaetia bacterium]|nr:DUF115 domain-containing protein [Spirochaetia bacterium]